MDAELADSEPSGRGDKPIEHRVFARVGLLGNPSDAYYGNTLSFSLANFWASASVQPSPRLALRPHPTHDPCEFTSLGQLAEHVQSQGYYGGLRLLMATSEVFFKFCVESNIKLPEKNFTLSYDTNIPRQAGLSGSSAIVCAAMNCLLEFYGVGHLVQMEFRPSLILRAEEELGITAGLQDRVVQVYGGLVYMDFNKQAMESLGHGIYTPMDHQLLPPLYLIYTNNPSDSGKVHSTVRKRWAEGDKTVTKLMAEIADLAVQGRAALLAHDNDSLARLMDRNFDLRRQIFGDRVLGKLNIQMVETARSVGAACKFTGSGGAVVAMCPNGELQAEQLQAACERAGFTVQPVEVAPSTSHPADVLK